MQNEEGVEFFEDGEMSITQESCFTPTSLRPLRL